jgi:hypothetical protein
LGDHNEVIRDDASVVIEWDVERRRTEGEDNNEEIEEDDHTAIEENVLLQIRNIACLSTHLFQRARNRLHRIITQFHFNETERNNILRVLDRFVSQTKE